MKQLLPTTPRIWSVTPDMPIADTTALMVRQGIKSLLVITQFENYITGRRA